LNYTRINALCLIQRSAEFGPQSQLFFLQDSRISPETAYYTQTPKRISYPYYLLQG